MKKSSYSFLSKLGNKNTIPKLVCGYTLIEIVIVISIMAVFSAIIYSSFDASRAKSRDQKRVSDVSTIQLALEQYFQRNGLYPTDLNGLVPVYISSIPSDPTNDYTKNYFPITKNSGSLNCISYQLWTKFELQNQYLDSKKSFNSANFPLPNNMYECGSGHESAKINVSVEPLVYDVMP